MWLELLVPFGLSTALGGVYCLVGRLRYGSWR